MIIGGLSKVSLLVEESQIPRAEVCQVLRLSLVAVLSADVAELMCASGPHPTPVECNDDRLGAFEAERCGIRTAW